MRQNETSFFSLVKKGEWESSCWQELLCVAQDLGVFEVSWPFPMEIHFNFPDLKIFFPEHQFFFELNWKADYQQFLKEKPSVRQDLFGRALFPKQILEKEKGNWLVFDGTCGTGKDTLRILAMGFKVMASERHPLLFLLLKHQESLLKKDYPHLPLDLRPSDFKKELPNLTQKDCFYFDPMYDQNKSTQLKERKSKPRQEMVALDLLLTSFEGDSYSSPEEDLALLLKEGFKRVVVKRPKKSALMAPHRNASFEGKSTRYDLYI